MRCRHQCAWLLFWWAWLADSQSVATMARSERALPPFPKDYNFAHPPSVPCGDENPNPSYRVPLSAVQEKRALEVFRKSFVILAHTHCVEPWDLEEMHRAGVTAAVVKVDVDGINWINGLPAHGALAYNPPDENWLARGTRAIRRLQEVVARSGGRAMIARSVADLRRAKAEEKLAIILSFEGARPLVGKLNNLRYYYDLGLRELQLWWAVPNELKTAEGKRLSEFGEDVIREMNRLGMPIDLSHMNGETFSRAIEVSTAPTVISHCSVAAMYGTTHQGAHADPEKNRLPSGTDRLNDATIRVIAAHRGAICLHFVTPAYITARHGTPKATVADFVDHVDYIRKLVGIDSVALGPDYFPAKGWQWIEGAGRVGMIVNVAREMVRRDFTDEEIAKVLGGNLMRVYQETWKTQ